MVPNNVLEKTGVTALRLREIFTDRDDVSENGKIRKKIEERIRSRMTEGWSQGMKNGPLWQAIDMAWDSTPIQPQTIPLMLWAQGKITFDNFVKEARAEGSPLKQFCREDKGQLKVDLPRLYEVSINLIRSYVTRRLAAQCARFSNLWPYFRYEPRGTDDVAKLRGDALSQRMDIMADQYNYRHFFPQSYRHMFLYGRAVIFPRCAWDIEHGWKVKVGNIPDNEEPLESYVEREGLDLVCPHPSRIYRDTSAPLPNINTNNGPRWIGFWDIMPYRDIRGGDYYNCDKVSTSGTWVDLVAANGSYFNYYYDAKVLTWPALTDPTLGNSRSHAVGLYGESDEDKGVVVGQHFELINPKQAGIGTLNANVWFRFSVAGDGTVIGAEPMPSLPAVYGGMNENDDRLVNTSMAMELMPFQDQLTNLFSQMLMNIRAGMVQIWAIDKDALDPEMVKHVEDTLKIKDYYTQPQAFIYSGSKLREIGVANPGDNPRAIIQIIQAQVQTSVDASMKAIGDVLNMADRILVLSPNEIGQPNPREVSAREVTEISSTTNSIASFISDGIDEQRAAVKKLLYESLICNSTSTFTVPVINRYMSDTIKRAGLDWVKTSPADADPNAIVRVESQIIGKASDLVYDYYFDSRDGSERSVSSQSAQVLSTLVGQVLQVPEIAQALGKKRILEIFAEIFRLSGAAYDLKLEIEDGESDMVPPAEGSDLAAKVAQIEQILAKLLPPSVSGPVPGAAPPADPSMMPADGGPVPTDGAPPALTAA
jgi:hypothetical protein